MRVGVTGSAGFIGRHIVATLAAQGHHPVALVNRTSGPDGVEARRLDVTRARETMAAFFELDALIHGAAHVPRGYRDPDEARACLEVNALGTLEVLRACREAGVGKVVVLTGNIYRMSATTADETSPVEPSSSAPYYLASKATADFYASHFDRAEGLPTAILRPSAVYGPGLDRGMIASFTSRLSAGTPVTIADGARYRADLVYVEDVAQASVNAAVGHGRGAFNVGAGATVNALEIAELLADLIGAPRSLILVEPPQSAGAVGFAALDIARAQRELAYAPRALAAGLSAYLAARGTK